MTNKERLNEMLRQTRSVLNREMRKKNRRRYLINFLIRQNDVLRMLGAIAPNEVPCGARDGAK